MTGGVGAVDLGVAEDAGALLVGELAAHLARHARDQRSRRDDRPLEHDRSPGDQASFADDGAREDDAAHADQRAVADRAAVHDGVVTDRDVLADDHRVPGIHVHRDVVLDVAAGPQDDAVAVGPQHGVVPDAGAFGEGDGADDAGTRRDEGAGIQPRSGALEGEDGGIGGDGHAPTLAARNHGPEWVR